MLIIVEVAGGESEARGFRIKCGHSIYAVLKGASKSFEIDPSRLATLSCDRETNSLTTNIFSPFLLVDVTTRHSLVVLLSNL